MKRFLTILALGLLIGGGAIYGSALADETPVPAVPGPGFVDEDGDGICDHFATRTLLRAHRGRMGNRAGNGRQTAVRDADGDGIPNGQDPDYVRPANGSGRGFGRGLRDGSCIRSGRLMTPKVE